MKILDCLRIVNPDIEFSARTNCENENDYNNNCVVTSGEKPSFELLKLVSKTGKYNAQEWDAQEYARDRTTAYPSTGDQLDYIYHNGVAKWKTDMIDPVKTKYPKG